MIKKIVNIIFTIFIVIITAITISIVIQTKLEKKDYANICGYSIFKIVSASMEPTIKIGNRVLVKSEEQIKEGDIIVYSNEEKSYICHRINKINEDKITCKGDSNNVEDDEIKNNQIIGKVIGIF